MMRLATNLSALLRRFAQAVRSLAVPVCALLVATVWAAPAAAQSPITVDGGSAVEAAGSSVTFNHTVGTGANRLIIVSIAIERDDTTGASVSARRRHSRSASKPSGAPWTWTALTFPLRTARRRRVL